jgi:hypothetical protein
VEHRSEHGAGAYLTRKPGDGALHPPSPAPCNRQFGERVVHVCKVISRHHTPWGKLGPPIFGKQRVGQIRQTVGRRSYHRSGDRTQKVVGSGSTWGSIWLHLAPSGSIRPTRSEGLGRHVRTCGGRRGRRSEHLHAGRMVWRDELARGMHVRRGMHACAGILHHPPPLRRLTRD